MSLDKTLASIAESLASLAETNRQLVQIHTQKPVLVDTTQLNNQHNLMNLQAGQVQYVEQPSVQFVQPPNQFVEQAVNAVQAQNGQTQFTQPANQAVLWTPEAMNDLAKQTAGRLGTADPIMGLFAKYNAKGFSTLDPAQFNNFALELQAL